MTVPAPPPDAAGGSPGSSEPDGAGAAPLDDLVSTARGTRVAVIGAGIAGLVAAHECAKVGIAVTVFERDAELGGTIRAADVAGHDLDLGPDGWATGGGHVAALAEELGLGDLVVPASGEGAWLVGRPFGAARLPQEALLGIPANTWDASARRIIGWAGAWRAYLDRLRPPLTIGKERNLDRLVRSRMGDLVADRLVAPISVGRYGLPPSEVDVEIAAPGLSTALTRTGSLGGAVGQLLAAPASGFETLDGGLHVMVAALRERLSELGAQVATSTHVAGIVASTDPPLPLGWRVLADGAEVREPFDAVIVAADEGEARRLLADRLPAAAEPASQVVVTLVVHQPALDPHPRGAVAYPLPGASPIASVAHVTARWPWLERVGDGVHVLRVAFPPGTTPAPDIPDVVVATAVAEASTLLGVALPPEAVRGVHLARFAHAKPVSAVGHEAAAAAVRQALDGADGLAVVGAWVAGSGLAQVVPDAAAQAELIRRAALFGRRKGR